MMRIGFFCYSLSGAGPRVRARTLISALASQTSHDIVLVTSEHGTFEHDSVEIHRILSPAKIFHPITALRVRRVLSKSDIVHIPVNVYQLAYVAAIGVGPRVAGAGIQHGAPYRRLVQMIGVKEMIETHEYVAELWEESGVDSTHIYPAVDVDQFHPPTEQQQRRVRDELNVPPNDGLVLFVGELKPLKGADIVSELPKEFRNDNVTVLVVGDGELNDEFTERDDLIYEGFIENEDLPEYYGAADVTVVPSRHESFSIVSLESISCGTPVVTTTAEDCVMARLFQNRWTYVWADRTPTAIAETILKLLKDADRYEEQVQQGFDTIDEMGLSIDDALEKYLGVYRRVTDS